MSEKKNDENFDEMFDKAFEQALNEHDFVPESSESWNKFEKKIKFRARRKKRLKLAVSFILVALLLGSPVVTKVFAFNPFYTAFKNVQHGIVTLIFGSEDNRNTKANTAPPPGKIIPSDSSGHKVESGDTTQQKFDSLEEAKTSLAFVPPHINYVPNGIVLKNVLDIFPHGSGKATTAVLFYYGPKNKHYTITIRFIQNGEKITSGYQKNGGQFEKVKIDNVEAYLFLAKDGTTSIEYMSEGKYISIIGNLKKDEIIKVAKGIE